jgi:putative tryptophan/tyrosine transport system substrate-binding protein
MTTGLTLRRRDFLRDSAALVGVSLLAGCGIPFGPSPPARLRKIGFLAGGSSSSNAANVAGFRQGLRELDYVEGEHVSLDVRYAEGRDERLPELAAELVRLGVDVIVTGSNAAILAAGKATPTIPIVFATTGVDLVATGIVASLARPGGNMTGLTSTAGHEHPKRMELLKEALPGLSRVAILWNQSVVIGFRETEAAAQSLGLQVLSLELHNPDEVETALAGATAGRADSLMVTGGPVFGLLAPQIANFAARHRLPAVYSNPPYIEAGGLIVYTVNIPENYRSAAIYVDRILKGASPADLPIAQPTKFDLVVNLKTAQASGITIPLAVLQQATEVIQ